MRPFFTALVIGWIIPLFASQVFSQPLTSDVPSPVKTVESDDACGAIVDLTAGYRADKLSWHIAGNRQGTHPNVRSELSWTDIEIYQLKLASRTVLKEHVYLRGHVNIGTVVSGDNRDSDYGGDNRTQEFSRSLNGVDGNDVWDASLGVGARFSFFDATMMVCPMLGYAISEQDLNIVDGYQAITTPPATTPIGPIAGLDSRYETRWKGPWLGVDLFFSIPCTEGPFSGIGVIFTGEYHWVDFDADANWNLREDFDHPVSFSHDADGRGLMAGARILFETRTRWGINLGMNVQEMTTDAGRDRIFFADGSVADTRLNEVRWRSFTFEAGVSYRF
ncbi:hypothetical protein DSCA_27090 [Desulfosarcina alkanivorans]|uniref:Protochlamydia outer membrane protein domain-containing protein n=1 Tax=Desulfosarcina alkanivorans TaxID=571177 RepID=A0A5K7YLS2_9BACT|nr:TonB-dependent receptor [Desulfosarcina alkanivorans]BBO68779.1 hypothetical protein DSCA_27090 [Desulfosarcina alkanivorans]